MLVRHSLLAAITGASLLAACAPPSVTAPVEVATTPTASQAPSSAVETRSVRIRAAVSDRALAEASVTVRLASDLSLVAEDMKLDGLGVITLPLDKRLKPGTIVVVQAKSGASTLSGLFTVPAAAFTIQQAGGSNEWLLDLATSAITRKLTSKLADVLRSLPPEGSSDAMQSVMNQMHDLVEKTRAAVQSGLQDREAAEAVKAALEEPTSENIEALANSLIRRSPLKADFVGAVEACNRQVFNNMAAGGPLVVAAPWQVFEVVVAPPQVRVAGENEVEIVYGDEKVTVKAPDAAKKVEEAKKNLTDTRSNDAFAELNTTVVAVHSSGGSRRSPNQQLSLQGTVTVAGVVRAGALVQLSSLNGTVVAKASSAADGSYAFYDIPDGVYHLIVAVDGAIQSTRVVTIGTPD